MCSDNGEHDASENSKEINKDGHGRTIGERIAEFCLYTIFGSQNRFRMEPYILKPRRSFIRSPRRANLANRRKKRLIRRSSWRKSIWNLHSYNGSAEACVSFAEKYGLLCERAFLSEPSSEDLRLWRTEIRNMLANVRMLPRVIRLANTIGKGADGKPTITPRGTSPRSEK